MKKKFCWLLALVAYLSTPVTTAYAETLTLSVSGNGSGSESIVSVQTESNQEVAQSNQMWLIGSCFRISGFFRLY